MKPKEAVELATTSIEFLRSNVDFVIVSNVASPFEMYMFMKDISADVSINGNVMFDGTVVRQTDITEKSNQNSSTLFR